MIGIYKFTNKYNRKCYIGKSKNIENRYKGHIKAAEHNCNGYFYNALRKYGVEGFDFEVVLELPWLIGHSKEEMKAVLDYWETFYIKYFGANIRQYGYNRTIGGDGISFWDEDLRKQHSLVHIGKPSPRKGVHLKESTKQLLREANLGKKQSTETIEKRKKTIEEIGHPFNGKHHTKETTDKISAKNKGKHASPDTEWKKGHEPWNKGKRGYKIKKSGKRTPEQCENIRRGRWGDKEIHHDKVNE